MKAILTYHSIDETESVVSLGKETFRRHMAWIRDAGVPVLPLSELVHPDCSTGISLTFDDGFQNFATDAWPILRDLGFPVTVFVVSGWVGRENGWDREDPRIPDLPLMSWDTLGHLTEKGVELGGHSRTHPDLRQHSGHSLRSEVALCREDIGRQTGNAPAAFAFPYGHLNAATVEAVETAGYSMAVTAEMAVLEKTGHSPFRVPRLDAFYFKRPGILERWDTGGFRRFLWFRARARRVRAVLSRTGLMA